MRLFKLLVPILFSIILIVLDARFSYLDSFKRFTLTLLSPIYFVVDLPSHVIDWVNDQGSETAQLVSKNEYLEGKLTELKARLQTYNNLVLENQKLTQLLDATYTIPEHQITLAHVKSISQSRLRKQIIINKGSKDGVHNTQLIVSSEGVVGQVTQVTPLYSTVLLITDPTQHMPVKNVRNGIRGITKGLATNEIGMIVEFIPLDSDVKLGDIFVTSGVGTTYPPGYLVGEVSKVDKPPNEAFLTITLKPMQNMDKLEFVLIVSEKND
ncbi:rod shape-determining protein MreC [Candidatus Thioglobus sp.]|nr:rod shape-determining protein MreC [Candidatus Thioglobus sp.]